MSPAHDVSTYVYTYNYIHTHIYIYIHAYLFPYTYLYKFTSDDSHWPSMETLPSRRGHVFLISCCHCRDSIRCGCGDCHHGKLHQSAVANQNKKQQLCKCIITHVKTSQHYVTFSAHSPQANFGTFVLFRLRKEASPRFQPAVGLTASRWRISLTKWTSGSLPGNTETTWRASRIHSLAVLSSYVYCYVYI